MNSVLAQLSVAFLGTVLVAPSAVMAGDVPDALSVEWQGQKFCEKLSRMTRSAYRTARFRRERRTSATPIPRTSSVC